MRVRVIKVIGGVALIMTSACSGVGRVGGVTDGADFMVSGTTEGVKAWGDFMNGMNQTAKSAPNMETEWGALRRTQEQERTKRSSFKVIKPRQTK